MRHTSATFASLTALIGALTFSACGSADIDTRVSSSSDSIFQDLSVCATDDYQLIAGQNTDAGAVRIDNDGENLLIQVIGEGWLISEVHIFAGTGSPPVNRKGTVVPGHFPYNTTYSTPVALHTQSIPLADLGVGCGDTLNTVVHAVVRRATAGGGFQEETAFGDGTPLPTTRWGFSSTREICCEEPPPPPPPPPPEEECPPVEETEDTYAEAHCVETIDFWAADTAGWPDGQATWVICWSQETGEVLLTTAVTSTGSSPAFDALVDEIAAAGNNQKSGCADMDCVVEPAFFEGVRIVNDCHVDESESARAAEITALLRSFNDGTYDYGQCLPN